MEENDDDTLFRLVDGMIQGRNEFLNDHTIRGLPFVISFKCCNSIYE